MPFIAILNAVIREKICTKFFRELTCHQLFTLMLMIMMSLYTWMIYPLLKIEQSGEAWLNGIIWLLLTLIFEFFAGHYIFKNSWTRLFQDYNLIKGRVWSLFILFILILPYLIYGIKN
jgi:hypothetical protein